MRFVLALLAATCLLTIIHSFPPEGLHATVIDSYIDDAENRWLVVELDGGGYCKTRVSDRIYLQQQFKDRVRVLPFNDEQGHFLAWEGHEPKGLITE